MARNRLVASAAVVVAVVVVWLLARNAPTAGGPFPPCIFNLATGLYCPGCGGTRAAHLALNGDVVGGLRQNALAIAVMPIAAVYLFALGTFAVSGKWWAPRLTGRTISLVVAAVVITFAVARNIPGLEAIAPTPLPQPTQQQARP